MRKLAAVGNLSDMAMSPKKDWGVKKKDTTPLSIQLRTEREKLFNAKTRPKRIRIRRKNNDILP